MDHIYARLDRDTHPYEELTEDYDTTSSRDISRRTAAKYWDPITLKPWFASPFLVFVLLLGIALEVGVYFFNRSTGWKVPTGNAVGTVVHYVAAVGMIVARGFNDIQLPTFVEPPWTIQDIDLPIEVANGSMFANVTVFKSLANCRQVNSSDSLVIGAVGAATASTQGMGSGPYVAGVTISPPTDLDSLWDFSPAAFAIGMGKALNGLMITRSIGQHNQDTRNRSLIASNDLDIFQAVLATKAMRSSIILQGPIKSSDMLQVVEDLYGEYLSLMAKGLYFSQSREIPISAFVETFQPRLFLVPLAAHILAVILLYFFICGLMIHILHARSRKGIHLIRRPGTIAASLAYTALSNVQEHFSDVMSEEIFNAYLRRRRFKLDRNSGMIEVMETDDNSLQEDESLRHSRYFEEITSEDQTLRFNSTNNINSMPKKFIGVQLSSPTSRRYDEAKNNGLRVIQFDLANNCAVELRCSQDSPFSLNINPCDFSKADKSGSSNGSTNSILFSVCRNTGTQINGTDVELDVILCQPDLELWNATVGITLPTGNFTVLKTTPYTGENEVTDPNGVLQGQFPNGLLTGDFSYGNNTEGLRLNFVYYSDMFADDIVPAFISAVTLAAQKTLGGTEARIKDRTFLNIVQSSYVPKQTYFNPSLTEVISAIVTISQPKIFIVPLSAFLLIGLLTVIALFGSIVHFLHARARRNVVFPRHLNTLATAFALSLDSNLNSCLSGHEDEKTLKETLAEKKFRLDKATGGLKIEDIPSQDTADA
ncbi:hypothetical protein M422DRAFT_246906 [Sphaerobolus stellatus SS14]|nr:hypothetical protein M422DRAFT_246906 [Sphaerobolus stellatus SS14]